ncbi:ras-associated and pleckstrin homology domains-containing protein 1-like [Limulus polyphemus]|uniref:Ras-associated and pleckstrin homology domains-containing protein 1-like n=1 Tax=Limulus polyphemus TaxID=6850 RepID=A0ABM1SBD4_LIMPO|nr:ras-associated and pleckstrin homology domains-containing protein 1-like [Limulus polyphemus]
MSDSPSHSSTGGQLCSPSSTNSNSQQQKHLGPDDKTHNQLQHRGQSSPTSSPLSSPKSSPYVSPPHSGTSSRSTSPWTSRISMATDRGSSSTSVDSSDISSLEHFLKKEGLRKYIQNLHGYTIEKLQTLNEHDLRSFGLTMGATRKLKKALDGFRSVSLPNGIVNHSYNISVTNNHQCSHAAPTGPSFSLPNSDSSPSPSCSVDSSPSPSPPSLEGCILRSPTSSSSEESLPGKGRPIQKSDNARNVGHTSKVSYDPNNRVQQGGFYSKHNKKLAEKEDSYVNGREGGDSLKNITNYGMTVPFLFPPPDIHPPKPNSLPLYTRAAATPPHLGAGTIIIENSQLNRNPLAFLPSNPPHRSHSGTPERSVNPPVSFSGGITFYQFPLITSGGASLTTATRSFVTYLGHSTVTVTTVGSGKFVSKTVDTVNTKQVPDPMPNVYHYPPCVVPAPGAAVQSNGVVISTNNAGTSTVASSTATTSHSNASTSIHTPPPSSLPYSYFLPHFLPQAFPFVAAHNNTPANGFVSPNLHVPPPTPSFPFHLPNGLNAGVSPDMVYPPQGFPLPSPSGPPPPTPPVTPYLGYLGNGSSYPHNHSVPLQAPTKPVTCYNCGAVGHRGNECKSATLDEMTKSGHFRLHFVPSPKTSESNT